MIVQHVLCIYTTLLLIFLSFGSTSLMNYPIISSSLYLFLDFSKLCWGLTYFPIVTLYRPLLHNTICISSLQSRQLKGVKILGVKAAKFSSCRFMGSTILLNSSIYLQKQFNSKANQFNHSLLQHVHIIRVPHTYIDFYG